MSELARAVAEPGPLIGLSACVVRMEEDEAET